MEAMRLYKDGKETSYVIRDGRFYYNNHVMYDVDIDSFEVLENGFSKDKNNIYYRSRTLKDFVDINYEKFKIFNTHYAGDDKILLYNGEYLASTNTNINDVKLIVQESFSEKQLSKYYDLNATIGERNWSVNNSNIDEFIKTIRHEINEKLSRMIKDKSYIYLYNFPLKDIDAENAEVIYAGNGVLIIQDKNSVWIYNDWNERIRKITDDVNHFRILSHHYFYDSNILYINRGGRIIKAIKKNFNVKLLTVKSYGIICYGKYVYDEHGKLIKEAEPETFEALNFGFFGKDKNHVFIIAQGKNIIFSIADATTFETLSSIYSKDKNYVFYKEEPIPEADPITFELIGQVNSGNAKDKNKGYVYEEMEKWYNEISKQKNKKTNT